MADLFDWLMKNSGSIFDTGMGIYDYVNKENVAGNLQGAATSGLVDPFGADNREYYQGQLRSLENDPSGYLQNTPGYQFARDEATREVNRQAARSGHYMGTKRLHDIGERMSGLASQRYDTTHDQLMQGAGGNFQPNAAAYAAMMQTAAGQQAGNTGSLQDAINPPKQANGSSNGGLIDILKNFGDAAGGEDGFLSGILGETGIGDTLDGWGESLGDWGSDLAGSLGIDTGAVGDWFGDTGLGSLDWGSAGKSVLEGDYQGAATDLAKDYVMGEGKDYLTGQVKELYANYMGGNDTASATDAITGMMDNEYGADLAAQGGQYGSLSGASAMGAGLGGALGGWGLTKLLGTEGNAATATTALGGVAGTAIGAGLGGMVAGTGFGAGAGAIGGAAAGGALAGPMIPLALAMIAYGSYSEDKASSKARKDAAGQLDSGLTLQADGGSNWDSDYGNFYINKAAQDMWYSGDISRGMGLFDQNDHNKYVGNFNWDTGKVEDRDFLLSEGKPYYSMEGLTGSQRAEQSAALTNYWDNTSVGSGWDMPYSKDTADRKSVV